MNWLLRKAAPDVVDAAPRATAFTRGRPDHEPDTELSRRQFTDLDRKEGANRWPDKAAQDLSVSGQLEPAHQPLALIEVAAPENIRLCEPENQNDDDD